MEHFSDLIAERKKVEEQLRRSEDSYRRLVDFSPEPMAVYNQEGIVIYVNEATVKLMGATDFTELIGQKSMDFIHPEYVDAVTERVRQVRLEAKEALPMEEKFLTIDGRVIDVEVSSLPIFYQGKSAVQVVIHDITAHKEMEEVLKRQSAAMKASMDGMVILNHKGRIVYNNDALLKIYGYKSATEIIGKSWSVFYHKSEYQRAKREIIPSFNRNGQWRGELIGKKKSAITFPQEVSLSLIEGGGIVCVVRDITERKQAEAALRYQAYHDPLTNLPNRMLFSDRLNMALTYANRNRKKLAVLFLDMDNYKNINDILGHTIGDQLLLGISERIITSLQEEATVGRFSGDEFAILLPEIADVEAAAMSAQKILAALREPWIIDGQEFYITCSIGMAIYPNDGDSAQNLMKHADIAMSGAKERRDSYQLFTSDMNTEAMARLAMERELRKALEKNEFVVYYQPQIDINDCHICGMEALVRWNHPKRGLIAPMEFIPLAEATGLIIPIGEWVLLTSCSQNKAWIDAGHQPMRVSVNLSACQFQQKNLLDTVAQVLNTTGLDAVWLQLEITESVAMHDVEYTIKTLGELKNMGIQIAIDDFGTGYSSLNYLKLFPISTLKIDRSFVIDITRNQDDAAILTSIIFLAHNLNLNVIAEGVETPEQFDFLRKRRCEQIQGYLFSKPVPAEQFINLLKPKKQRGI